MVQIGSKWSKTVQKASDGPKLYEIVSKGLKGSKLVQMVQNGVKMESPKVMNGPKWTKIF